MNAKSKHHVPPAAGGSEPTPPRLQQLVRERMAELDESYRAAAERSHGLVSHSVLSRIAAGTYNGRRIKGDTLAGIALALQLPESQVREAAAESLRPRRWVSLSAEFSRMDEEHQQRAIEMMEALLSDFKRAERERRARENPFK